MKNNKIDYKQVKEFLSSPKGKMVAFFGFYFIFFFFLGVVSRMSLATSSDYDTKDVSDKFDFSLEKIKANNYHFKYAIDIDTNKYIYEGDRKDDKALFTFNNESYYQNSDHFLKNTNGIWLKIDNPYVMKEFIDIHYISDVLNKSSYISKTDYESGIKTYIYQISTTTLVKLLDNNDIDLDDISNEIFIKSDENNHVDEIRFTLDSYCQYKNIGTNCQVDLNYSNFSKVEDRKDPE